MDANYTRIMPKQMSDRRCEISDDAVESSFLSIHQTHTTYNIARGAGKSALSMDAGGLKRIRDSVNRARARFDLANCQEAAPTRPRASVPECGTLSRPALILVIKSEPYRRRNDDAVLPGIFRS